MRNISLL